MCGNDTNHEDLNIGIDEKLFGDLSKALEDNKLVYADLNFKVWQKLSFSLYTQSNVTSSENIENIATIDKNGFQITNRNGLKKIKRYFRIGIVEGIPWTYRKKDPITGKFVLGEKNQPLWEGYCIDFIEALSIEMNFIYDLVLPKSGTFGERISDNSFDGVIGDLILGETDMIVAALKMTAEREEVIDFVAPYFEQTGISIVMKKPIPDRSLFKFMTVLKLEVWLSICGAIGITAIVLWILELLSPYSARNFKYNEESREFTLRESIWFALTSFTPQGGGEVPKAFSGRVVVATYWLFVVLMLATFTANLAAFLTVERMQTPVQSLEQLSRQSRIAYTVVEGSDAHQYFKNMKHAEDKLYDLWKQTTLNASSDESVYRVWDYPLKEQYSSILMSIESAKTLPNASEGFRIVNEREDFAFIHDVNDIKYELSRNCNFSVVGDTFADQPYAIAVQQGSELQDELTRTIVELQKRHFFEDLLGMYWNSSLKGDCEDSDNSEGITLDSLGGIFIATIVGLVIAMLVLAIEVYYYKREARKGKENTTNNNISHLLVTTVQPFESYKHTKSVLKQNNILLGHSEEFVPRKIKNFKNSIQN
ncbi:unnamed protein product [Chironomus riparius]|uniref:Ionotropic receptor n=1 Tax=Chironomus riparius TaxID=315576 RepID=A0A9P0IZ03_9DIPT|nr:unnamed protein product [Chironomus riparius]